MSKPYYRRAKREEQPEAPERAPKPPGPKLMRVDGRLVSAAKCRDCNDEGFVNGVALRTIGDARTHGVFRDGKLAITLYSAPFACLCEYGRHYDGALVKCSVSWFVAWGQDRDETARNIEEYLAERTSGHRGNSFEHWNQRDQQEAF